MKEKSELKAIKKELKKKKKVFIDISWILKITLIGFIISLCFSFLSEMVISNASLILGIVILIIFIAIGIIFDIIGVAVTASDEAPFHSMNSRKVKGADVAVMLLHNAEKVSSFCNDVVGDICGIVSGTTASIIAISIANTLNYDKFMVTLLITAIVAALTIGGKAIGKSFAVNKSNYITYEAAKFISSFTKK